MQWTKRLCGLGAAMLLGATVVLASSNAFAVTIPADVYTLPVGGGDATTVDLGVASTRYPSFPQWTVLHKNDPTDPLEDFTRSWAGTPVDVSGDPTPSDPWLFNMTLTVTWNGTVGEQAPPDPYADEMLFAILDSRVGPKNQAVWSADTTTDLADSGFVRGSFAVNGVSIVPEIILDDTGPMSGDPEGFARDDWNPGINNRWIGFYLPATTETQTITMQWALGEPWDNFNDDVFFHDRLFLATVPEPGTAVLTAVGILILGVSRRARHRGA